jgi:hypothetical protein
MQLLGGVEDVDSMIAIATFTTFPVSVSAPPRRGTAKSRRSREKYVTRDPSLKKQEDLTCTRSRRLMVVSRDEQSRHALR